MKGSGEGEKSMDSDLQKKQKKVIVPLDLVYGAIEEVSDSWRQYLDIEEMKVVSVPEFPFGDEEDQESQELEDMIEEGWQTRFFGLPSKFDIHEYHIMEEFVWSLPEGKQQNTLESAIQGRGAFRRFKDTVYRFGLEQKWYDFQAEKYRELAMEWCESHGFGYRDGKAEEKTAGAGGNGTEPKNGDEGENLAWEEIRTEHIVQDEWIDFKKSAYRFPDGSVFEPYYSYSRRDYVVIVASDLEGKYLCVRQFRQGIKKVTTEFPAGGIERKDGKEYGGPQDYSAEDALAAAKRELLEETGYESDEWRHLLTVPSNATIADNYAHLFAAGNCRRVSGQALDETEFLNITRHSAQEIEEQIAQGEFQQAIHITAWLLALKR